MFRRNVYQTGSAWGLPYPASPPPPLSCFHCRAFIEHDILPPPLLSSNHERVIPILQLPPHSGFFPSDAAGTQFHTNHRYSLHGQGGERDVKQEGNGTHICMLFGGHFYIPSGKKRTQLTTLIVAAESKGKGPPSCCRP